MKCLDQDGSQNLRVDFLRIQGETRHEAGLTQQLGEGSPKGMPKIHNIGKTRFTQFIDFPVKWGWRVVVRGWTQEIERPFRTSEPLIFRMPFHKALVLGKWTGQQPDEESALSNAIQGRVLTDEDFSEEKGWIPAPEQTGEEDC
jgi:hypothetical protein